MAITSFSSDLFDGNLDFPCTYIPRNSLSFPIPAILAYDGIKAGSEAGKGLNRGMKGASAEWKHFRVPCEPFECAPAVGDIIRDDRDDDWLVQSFAPSRAGTYLIYAKANGRYRGPESGITRL